MKKVAAEGANRDASYVGKLFPFFPAGGPPTVQFDDQIRSLSAYKVIVWEMSKLMIIQNLTWRLYEKSLK